MKPETKELLKEALNKNPLFVFAMQQEAADEFISKNVLITGIGKVNAAYSLTKRLAQSPKPSIIVNLGSGGSQVFKTDEVVCCTTFVQRDMDATALGFKKYQTPFSEEPPLLVYGYAADLLQTGICGSGDHFEANHTTADYNIVDMEAYAIALIALREQIPFLCLKYISDGADGRAGSDWQAALHKAAAKLKEEIIRLG